MQQKTFNSTAKITASNKFFNTSTSLNADYDEKGGLTNLPKSRLDKL